MESSKWAVVSLSLSDNISNSVDIVQFLSVSDKVGASAESGPQRTNRDEVRVVGEAVELLLHIIVMSIVHPQPWECLVMLMHQFVSPCLTYWDLICKSLKEGEYVCWMLMARYRSGLQLRE